MLRNAATAALAGFAAIAIAAGTRAAQAPGDVVARTAVVPWECATIAAANAAGFPPLMARPDCDVAAAPRVRFARPERPRFLAPQRLPGAPTGLTAVVSPVDEARNPAGGARPPTGATVVLNWQADPDASAESVVEAGSAPGRTDLAIVHVGAALTGVRLTAVKYGTYYFRVRTQIDGAMSAASNEAAVVVGAPCAAIASAPTGMTATSSGSTVTLTWLAPAVSSDCAIGSYVLEAGSATGLSNLANFSIGTSLTLFSTSGVGDGTYYVRVRAVNSAGTSAPSNEATLVVGTPPCTVAPPAPTGFAATVTGSTVALRWTAPAGIVTGYTLEAGSATGLSDLVVQGLGNQTTLTATSVGTGAYYVRVRARNNCGTGAGSNEAVVIVGGTRTMIGTLYDSRTLNVLAGATVSVLAGVGSGQTTTTDFNGRFSVIGVAGSITLVASAGGYRTLTKTVDALASNNAQHAIDETAGRSGSCGDAPGIGNRLLQQLGPPFSPNRQRNNYFDHTYPQEFSDANGIVTNACGERVNTFDGHQGYDFNVPLNTPLIATGDGQIVFAGPETPFFCPPLNATVSGNWVQIRHAALNGEQVVSEYGHLTRIDVRVGQTVTKGQQVGLSGTTGCSTGPHLHFEVFRTTNTVTGGWITTDPYGWEGTGADPWAVHRVGTQSFWLWLPGQNPPIK